MDLEPDAIEQRFLEMSRQCHPDAHPGAAAEQLTAILSRSADINRAYALLVDPWRRAEALLERGDPSVLEHTKKLDPAFLMAAMELAEEVASTTDGQGETLRARLEETVADDLRRCTDLLAAGQLEGAATVLHQSRYHRKALADLDSS